MDGAADHRHHGRMIVRFPMSRRSALGLAGAAALALPALRLAQAGEPPLSPAAEALVLAFARGAPLGDSGLSLDMDDSVDDGSSVSIALAAESPMTPADHVEAILIIAPENPLLTVAEFRFTPMSGRAFARTRIRLAKSQTVLALARSSTGSVTLARRHVDVVANGCVG
jgi:sulfur-oxidizing protein SoxY